MALLASSYCVVIRVGLGNGDHFAKASDQRVLSQSSLRDFGPDLAGGAVELFIGSRGFLVCRSGRCLSYVGSVCWLYEKAGWGICLVVVFLAASLGASKPNWVSLLDRDAF